MCKELGSHGGRSRHAIWCCYNCYEVSGNVSGEVYVWRVSSESLSSASFFLFYSKRTVFCFNDGMTSYHRSCKASTVELQPVNTGAASCRRRSCKEHRLLLRGASTGAAKDRRCKASAVELQPVNTGAASRRQRCCKADAATSGDGAARRRDMMRRWDRCSKAVRSAMVVLQGGTPDGGGGATRRRDRWRCCHRETVLLSGGGGAAMVYGDAAKCSPMVLPPLSGGAATK